MRRKSAIRKDIAKASDSVVEQRMYPAVELFFRSLGADVVRSATKGNTLSLLHDDKYVRPDVAAIVRGPSGQQILMAEGKLLGGHRFLDCVTQAELWLRYADKVYVFFPSDAWNKLAEEQRDTNLSLVQRKRLGLLTVGPRDQWQRVEEAPQSEEIIPSRYSTAHRQMDNRLPEFPAIGRAAAVDAHKVASATIALADIVLEALRNGKYNAIDGGYYVASDCFSYEIYPKKEGSMAVSIDPFGTYFEDGVPKLLIGVWYWAVKRAKVPKSLPVPPGNFVAFYSNLPEDKPTIFARPDSAQLSRLLSRVQPDGGVGFFETMDIALQNTEQFQQRLLAALARYAKFDRQVSKLWKHQ